MNEEEKEEIKNIIDYVYGASRDIEVFLSQNRNGDCNEAYKKASINILSRIHYQLEQTQKMLENLVGDKNGRS